MKVRLATEADHEAIMAIQAANPDLMPLDPYQAINGPVIVAVDDNGSIVGVAIARRTVEAFMYLKPEVSSFNKARAIKGLSSAGFHLMGEIGYCEAHILTTNDGFAKLCEGLPGAHADTRRHIWVNLQENK